MPTPRRSPARMLGALLLGALAAVLVCAPSAMASWPTFDTAQPATFASGVQAPGPDAEFRAISCVSAGNCTAVGRFRNAGGDMEAFTQTMTNGVWGNGVAAEFAAGVQYPNPNAFFASVSCTSPGNCTAAGQIQDVNGDFDAFTQTMTNGVWGLGQPATFPSGLQWPAPDSRFTSVSCWSAGNCTAVGKFSDSGGHVQAFTHTMTGGVWATARPATFAAGVQSTAPNAVLSTVSCPSAGNCTAAGEFLNSGLDREAFTQTMTDGTWGDAVPTTFASGIQDAAPDDGLHAVSCTSAGNCVAAGIFQSAAGGYEAFTQTSTDGLWATAVPATLAAGMQNASPYATFADISCASAGNCTAAGSFTDAVGDVRAFTQTMTGGTWGIAQPAIFASGVEAPHPYTEFRAVSCASAGTCAAVGGFFNAQGGYEAFTQTMTGGTWNTAQAATFASGVQNATPNAQYNGVACTVGVECIAAGVFQTAAAGSEREAFTARATPPPGPTPTPGPNPAPAPSPATPASNDPPVTPVTPPVGRVVARTGCLVTSCTTTGVVPDGAVRITQTATSVGSAHSLSVGALRVRPAARRVAGSCTIHAGRSRAGLRTYTCTITLPPGAWVVTTSARSANGTLVARSARRVRSRRWTAVTG